MPATRKKPATEAEDLMGDSRTADAPPKGDDEATIAKMQSDLRSALERHAQAKLAPLAAELQPIEVELSERQRRAVEPDALRARIRTLVESEHAAAMAAHRADLLTLAEGGDVALGADHPGVSPLGFAALLAGPETVIRNLEAPLLHDAPNRADFVSRTRNAELIERQSDLHFRMREIREDLRQRLADLDPGVRRIRGFVGEIQVERE